jgi:predicted secreted Zn-dependent protease
MKAAAFAALLLFGAVVPADAAQLSKTYSYFSIGGSTLDDIEKDLARRGPNVSTTGQRHPGATRMEFKTKLAWTQKGNSCRLTTARVNVSAKVILPQWKPGRRANRDTRLIWGTLAADIKRHEETHVRIANNHARELEDALKKMGSYRTCKQVSEHASRITKRILDKHDREQQRFDRIESAGFEKRFFRLLENRMRATKTSQRTAGQPARKGT